MITPSRLDEIRKGNFYPNPQNIEENIANILHKHILADNGGYHFGPAGFGNIVKEIKDLVEQNRTVFVVADPAVSYKSVLKFKYSKWKAARWFRKTFKKRLG